MRIVMAGASGFLGSALRASFTGDGHEVVRLVRRAPAAPDERRWHPDAGALDATVLAGADVVVNLAGAGVATKRWSPAYRQVLRDSRVLPTTTLSRTIASLPADARPRVLVNASGIGFYGDTGDTEVDETSPAGGGFIPDLCRAWEAATSPAAEAECRVVLLRSGLVLDSGGGLLRPLALATRLGAGGPLAGGRQWMPWISRPDWVEAVRFLIGAHQVAGPVNVVGPAPVRNQEFARTLGRVLHRPAPWPIPRFVLHIVLGDLADEVVASQRVLPGVLTRTGFAFRHAELEQALRAVLDRPA